MYTIRETARMFGLSRAALLYYDRIGLFKPAEYSGAGYRLYDENSIEELRRICTYRSAGLKLSEIRELINTPDTQKAEIVKNRIAEINREISSLRMQQRLLIEILKKYGSETSAAFDKKQWIRILEAAGMSGKDMDRWHAEFEKNAPEAHHAFLLWLGIPEREAGKIRSDSGRTK